MEIPLAQGGADIAHQMIDVLYDGDRKKVRVAFGSSRVNALHPGTVLTAAIEQLALSFNLNSNSGAPFAVHVMRDLALWLGGYLEYHEVSGDMRMDTPRRFHALVERLLAYYA